MIRKKNYWIWMTEQESQNKISEDDNRYKMNKIEHAKTLQNKLES